MRALEAVMDTFLASIPSYGDAGELDTQSFYYLSASEAGVPNYAAGLMHSKLKPDLLKVARVVLWLLSTRVGTYVLFGHGSVCGNLPFLKSFDEIPWAEREKLLVSAWSHSPYLFFRTLFNAFNIFASYNFFTKVDKHGFNPSWNAIGYCGPDPAAMEHRRNMEKAARKPLEGKVFDASISKESLSLQLEEAGFEVLKDVSHMASLWKQEKSGATEASKNTISFKCDAVVVGSGSGGGVAAGVLAKAGYKVLVLEKAVMVQNQRDTGKASTYPRAS